MSRNDIYIRVGAAVVALAIAASVLWAYGMTATIIGAFLALPQKPAPKADNGVVNVMVLPTPGTKPAELPQTKSQSGPQNGPK